MSWNVRVRGLRFCASLVLAVAVFTAPPVLAAEQKTPPPVDFAADSPQVRDGTARERQRFARRDSAEARKERRASRERYRGSSRGEAIALGRRFFPEAFVAPLFDGEQMAPGLELVGYRGTDAAIAEQADGSRLLLQSTLPLRTRTANGVLAPVDLSLRESAAMFTTVNSSADLQISADADKGAELLGADLAFAPETSAEAVGTTTADRVFYGETQTDTDFIVTPTATGTEFSWLLRSPDAPQRLILNVDLPAGAVIRRVRTEKPIPGDPPKSLEVVVGDDVLAYVRPPIVYDADGVSVAAEMTVEGHDKVVITAEHRDQDLRYPLNADPVVDLQSNQWAPWYGWSYAQAPSNGYPGVNYYGYALQNCAYNCSGPYVSMPTNTWFSGSGTAGGYSFRPPANTYVNRVQLAGLAHKPLAPNTTLSQFYDGILNPAGTAWQPGVTWSFSTVAPAVSPYLSGNNPFGPWAGGVSQPGVYQDVCCDSTDGNWFNISLQAAYSSAFYTYGYSSSLSLAGAGIYLGDKHPPALSANPPRNNAWVDDADNPTHTLRADAHDDGLGLNGITLSGAATGNRTSGLACTGHWYTGRCGPTHGDTFGYTLNEGINNLSLQVRDIVANTASIPDWQEKIDNSKPAIGTPTGNIWEAREQPTDHRSEGFYGNQATLTVPVSDAHSGVKEVVVLRDGVQWGSPATVTGGTATWTLNLDSSLPDGRYSIALAARDNVWSAASASASRHEKKTEPFYVTIDRSGDVVHATQWDGDPANGGAAESEEWLQPKTATDRSVTSGMIQTRIRQACDDDASKQCDEFRSVTRRRETHQPTAPESFARTSGRAGDPNVPQAGDLAVGDLGDPDGSGTINAIAPSWQHLPPGRGTTYTRFDFPDEYNGQPATYRSYIDDKTLLPLRGDVIDSTNNIQLATYWDYDLSRTSLSSYPSNFFKVDTPSGASNSTQADLRRNETMGSQRDVDTGTMFVPQFLGSVLNRVGLGVLCLASSDYIRFSGVSAQDETHEDPDPDVPPAQPGANKPQTIVTAQYLIVPSIPGCSPGTSAFEGPDVDVVSMASASGVAGAWRSAFAREGQSLPPLNGKPVYAVNRDDGKISALVDLGQTTVILTGPLAIGDVLPILQLLQPR